MGRLDGKAALITGAGRGIGRGIALTFGAEGAKVLVTSKSQSTIDSVVEEIRAAGGTAEGWACDVGKREDVETAVARCVERFGTIDILVNNAHAFGTEEKPTPYPVHQPFEELPLEEWEYTMRTGLYASVWSMRAAFPHMKAQGHGKIINFGSMSGQLGTAGHSAYASAKEAIRGMSRTAAREWGKYNINVNVINPAAYSASVQQYQKDYDWAGSNVDKIPLGRHGDPIKDIGPIALFLASHDSDFITGATVMADGGYLMQV
jgi:NAD(P)-dependent dehydrogenase (short-subunit alcohol dehydrogenase family)